MTGVRDIMMVYRICVCVDVDRSKSAYAVYNQQDFCVYKRVVDTCESDADREYIRVCDQALAYFKKNIGSRYYTEHFSELLDEDRCVVLCTMPELTEAFDAYRSRGIQLPPELEILCEHLDRSSVSFVDGTGDMLIARTKELI